MERTYRDLEKMKIRRVVQALMGNKDLRVYYLSKLGFFNSMPDEEYLSLVFKTKLGYDLDLHNPTTFNEKLQWLKLYDRNPRYTNLVDKFEAKVEVKGIIGEEYIVKNLGVWNSFDEIDFDQLPNSFVLKCTHDSGGVYVVKDKSLIDFRSIRKKIMKSLSKNYYYWSREWPYKDVRPRIIAEEFMGENIFDYKLMCFNGNVKCSFVCSDRNSKESLKVTFYDREWNRMPFERHYQSSKTDISCPENYEKMVELAEKLASGIPFVRVDFYEINGKVYFGEMTFFPGSGWEDFSDYEWDKKLGSWIDLNDIKRFT